MQPIVRSMTVITSPCANRFKNINRPILDLHGFIGLQQMSVRVVRGLTKMRTKAENGWLIGYLRHAKTERSMCANCGEGNQPAQAAKNGQRDTMHSTTLRYTITMYDSSKQNTPGSKTFYADVLRVRPYIWSQTYDKAIPKHAVDK